MEKITGKNNDLIKDIKKLLSSSKERKLRNAFVIEGARLVFDVLNSVINVKFFLVTDAVMQKYPESCQAMIERAEKSYIISEEISDKLSETQNSQGIFAVCKMQANHFALNIHSHYIALDHVQDPGNIGTIIRTAEALGIDGMITFGGCDVYNPKVLRSSMGSVLRMNIMHSDNLADTINALRSMGMRVYATSPDSSAKNITQIDFSNGAVCVIGNEANGISAEVKNCCNDLVTIKMLGKAESLNASVAAAITMWEMLR